MCFGVNSTAAGALSATSLVDLGPLLVGRGLDRSRPGPAPAFILASMSLSQKPEMLSEVSEPAMEAAAAQQHVQEVGSRRIVLVPLR